MSPDRLPFVDAHHHLWDLERHRYAWLEGEGWPEETAVLGDYSAIRHSYLVEAYLADGRPANLVKSVHVQADWSGGDPVDETRWLQSVADRTGFPHAIVAHADLAAPGAGTQLERHLAFPNVRGIRSTPEETRPEDAAFRRGVAALGRFGLSYDLRATPESAGACRALAEAAPDVMFLVGHAGEPAERSPDYRARWRRSLATLAGAPNVALKLSGLPMRDHRWTPESLRPWILDAIDAFGVDRCMFGTNWPVDSLYSTFEALVDAYASAVASFTEPERRALFAGNAERCYRI